MLAILNRSLGDHMLVYALPSRMSSFSDCLILCRIISTVLLLSSRATFVDFVFWQRWSKAKGGKQQLLVRKKRLTLGTAIKSITVLCIDFGL